MRKYHLNGSRLYDHLYMNNIFSQLLKQKIHINISLFKLWKFIILFLPHYS